MRASKERSQEQMKKKTLGMMIAALRKENEMTQLDLAEKMGVTDKAVSKWERDLSCPDVNTLPKLAEVFGISVDELMQIKAQSEEKKDISPMIHMIMKAIALAMGVAVVVLSILKALDVNSGMGMLGIGLACIAITSFIKRDDEEN